MYYRLLVFTFIVILLRDLFQICFSDELLTLYIIVNLFRHMMFLTS